MQKDAKFHFITAKTEGDLTRFHPIVQELRKDLRLEDFLDLYKQAHERDDYEIIGIEKAGRILGAMGYRIILDLVHGKHLYIDDLVTTEASRSQGLGRKLLEYAEKLARELNCKGLRLCTGIDNERGKKFY